MWQDKGVSTLKPAEKQYAKVLKLLFPMLELAHAIYLTATNRQMSDKVDWKKFNKYDSGQKFQE